MRVTQVCLLGVLNLTRVLASRISYIYTYIGETNPWFLWLWARPWKGISLFVQYHTTKEPTICLRRRFNECTQGTCLAETIKGMHVCTCVQIVYTYVAHPKILVPSPHVCTYIYIPFSFVYHTEWCARIDLDKGTLKQVSKAP